MQTYNKILRSTDADPFAEAAGGIDTSYPVLMPDRVLPFRVSKAEKKRNEEKGNEYIALKLTLNKDATFKDGKPARAGFVVNSVIAITPTEKYDNDAIKRSCAAWLKACLGIERASQVTIRSFMDNPAMLEQTIVDCKTSIKKADGSFPEGTNVSPVIPAS